MRSITVHTNDKKPAITIDLGTITRVEYKAAADAPEPRRAHLQIEVSEGGAARGYVFKGANAESAWATLTSATREQETQDDLKRLVKGTDRMGRSVEAMLRLYFADRLGLPSPERFVARRARLLSNDEEDGITLSLFAEIGVEHRTFVEIACGSQGGNSGFLALECGWRGLMVDADRDRLAAARDLFRHTQASIVESFVTVDNINALLAEHGLTGSIDLLSLDVDGNDYWLWSAITAASPRLVIIEYNSYFGPERSVVVPYDPAFDRHHYTNFFYGASLQAMTKLAARKGYRLVATEPRGHNAYFLRNDVAPSIAAVDPASAWRLLDKYNKRMEANQESLYDYAAREGMALVEVP